MLDMVEVRRFLDRGTSLSIVGNADVQRRCRKIAPNLGVLWIAIPYVYARPVENQSLTEPLEDCHANDSLTETQLGRLNKPRAAL